LRPILENYFKPFKYHLAMLKKQFQSTKPTCKVTFTLPKEAVNGGKEVKLLGEFNNWNPSEGIQMKASKSEFKTVVELEAGREYQFRYLIDNVTWTNDWAADAYLPTPYGVENSVVTVPAAKVTKTTAKRKPKATAKKVTTKAKPAKKTVTKKVTAKKVTAPKKVTTKKKVTRTADDLTKIEGIGPKIAQLMNDAGIMTFANMAKCSVTRMQKVLNEAGSRYKMHNPSTWAQQAGLAAKGEWTKLTKLQKKLNGGKK